MFTKSLFAAALLIPVVALSGVTYAGQTYRGGPKSGTVTKTAPAEPNKPYAQAVEERKGKHVYQGGPQSTIPHASH